MKTKNERGAVQFPLLFIIISLIIFVITALLTSSEAVKELSIALFIVVFLFGVIYSYFHYGGKSQKLRRLLQDLEKNVTEANIEDLKSKYLQAYNCYLKVSEKHKQNFYARLEKLRETIEEHLKNQKRLEMLLENTIKMSIQERKLNFQNVMDFFQKLPKKEQEKHYPRIVPLKEQLERESKV